MGKILHISHIQDLDGKSCPILTRIFCTGNEIETLMLTNKNMNTKIVDTISSIDTGDYDLIIITDLGVDAATFDTIANGISRGLNILFFDHHIDSTLNILRYENVPLWAYVDTNVSATKLYADSLKDTVLISCFEMVGGKKPYDRTILNRLDEFADNVSDYDTFKFKDNQNEAAERLNVLLTIAGNEVFEECVKDYILCKEPILGRTKDLAIVDYIFTDRQRYIDFQEKTCKVVSIEGRTCLVVFMDHFDYVSELGYQLGSKYVDLDLVMALNPNNGNVQLRSRKKSANLYGFAKIFGGGGHEFSAGFPFTMDFYKYVLDLWTESECHLTDMTTL